MAAKRDPIVPAQLERRVYETLLREITSGVLMPGEQLVEARIADELGVSKTPVREALIRLQRDGLVEIAPYRGARVLQPSNEDIVEILELRLCIESYIARDLAERRPAEVIAALQRSIAASREALVAHDQPAFLQSLRDFNDTLAAACGNRRMVRVLGELRNVLELIGNTSLRAAGREARSIAEHAAIVAAIRAGDPDRAAEATIEHIRSVERDSLQPTAGTEQPLYETMQPAGAGARSRR